MGNIIETLKDPALVRSIQEKLGVRQISVEVCQDSPSRTAKSVSGGRNEAKDSSINHNPVLPEDKPNNPFYSSDSSPSQSSDEEEGSIAWLVAKTTKIGRRRRHRVKTPAQLLDNSPYQSPTTTPSSPASTDHSIENVAHAQVMIVETNPFLDIYFRLATELGYEPFYIIFLSCMFWNVDIVVARWVVITWCFSMYVGQGAKQIFKLKRPSSPPAIRLEQNPSLETEYGFPSTHATVGTNIPFCILYVIRGRYDVPMWLGLIVAITWCVSVCLSRLYLGVHSVLDVLVGSLVAVVMFPVVVVMGMNLIEYYIYHSPYTPFFIIPAVIVLLYMYPVDAHHWSRDRGDTAAILGSGMGVLLGFCMTGPFPDDLETGPISVSLPSINSLGLSITRFVVGLLLLLPIRFVMKLLCFKLLPVIMPTHGVREEVKRPLVELPYKIITYGMLGFNAIYLCTWVFEICGISRFENLTPL